MPAAPQSTDYSRQIEGSEKVAILLLSLERPKASELLQHFGQDDIARIRNAADKLQPITPHDLQSIVEEFAEQFSNGVNFVGTPSEVHSLLTDALPESASEDEVQEATDSGDAPGPDPIWNEITQLPEEAVLAHLESENPQAAAFILSRINADYSANLIAAMRENIRSEILHRMATQEPVSEIAEGVVRKTLREKLLADGTQNSKDGAISHIADIINRLDSSERDQVLEQIVQTSPVEAAEIKKRLFSFEDIVGLPKAARSSLFDGLPPETVILALNGADSAVTEAALSAMGGRGKRMIEAELASGNPAPEKEVVAARREIAKTVLDMASRGEISLAGESE